MSDFEPGTRLAIHRPLHGSLRVFAPYGDGDNTRQWFRDVTHSPSLKLRWDMFPPQHWVVGRLNLADLAFGLADKFGEVDLMMDYRLGEKCGLKCQHAGNFECTCSCLGSTHGGPSRLNFLPIADMAQVDTKTIRTIRRIEAGMHQAVPSAV